MVNSKYKEDFITNYKTASMNWDFRFISNQSNVIVKLL